MRPCIGYCARSSQPRALFVNHAKVTSRFARICRIRWIQDTAWLAVSGLAVAMLMAGSYYR